MVISFLIAHHIKIHCIKYCICQDFLASMESVNRRPGPIAITNFNIKISLPEGSYHIAIATRRRTLWGRDLRLVWSLIAISQSAKGEGFCDIDDITITIGKGRRKIGSIDFMRYAIAGSCDMATCGLRVPTF